MKKQHLPSNPTITDVRRQPGEYLRAVEYDDRSFTITRHGEPVAQLVPVGDCVIESDGIIRGELPVTFRRNLGSSY